jgi:hypothetical protein
LAINRIRQAGGYIADSEMVMFEWLEKAGTPEFKDLIGLLKSAGGRNRREGGLRCNSPSEPLRMALRARRYRQCLPLNRENNPTWKLIWPFPRIFGEAC